MKEAIKATKKQGFLSHTVKGVLKSMLNIIFPVTCLICKTPLKENSVEKLICSVCWKNIKTNIPPLCAICGRQIKQIKTSKRVCSACQRQHFFFDRAFSPCVYEGVIRKIIHKFKYQNKDYLSLFLAKLLIDYVQKYNISLHLLDIVIPIPLHKTRLREREFNQSELLASRIAEEFSLSFSHSNLWRKHHRKSQMELREEERWTNIKDCFALREPEKIKNKNILLVDDVLTTGATCSEAASILKKAGATSVFVLTLANSSSE